MEAVLTWSCKNTSSYRCFQERHMHNLPRLNGCGVLNERQYCFLSADEIFFTFNEPFFGNMSLTQFLSYGDMLAWLLKNTTWHWSFQERDMHILPRLNGCGLSNVSQYCFSICWWNILYLKRAVFRRYVINWSLVIWRLCEHGRSRIHPDIDVSKYAICTICRGWMAAGYQMKGNIVFYLLMKYVSRLTSRFSTICL